MAKKISRQEIRELSYRNGTKRKMLSLFHELRSAQATMILFRTLLAVIVWSMIVMLSARFFLISPLYLIPIPLIILIIGIIRMTRADPLKKAEKTNPNFKEQLTTAKDNFTKENEMIEQLEEDILMRARLISSASYFEKRPVFLSVIMICMLIFVSSSISGYDVRDLPRILKPVVDIGEDVLPRTLPWLQRVSATGTEGAGDIEGIDDIYGDGTEFLEGTREIPIELQSARDSLDLSSIKEVEQSEFDSYNPTNLRIEGAETYENTIPLDKYHVVRNYFTND